MYSSMNIDCTYVSSSSSFDPKILSPGFCPLLPLCWNCPSFCSDIFVSFPFQIVLFAVHIALFQERNLPWWFCVLDVRKGNAVSLYWRVTCGNADDCRSTGLQRNAPGHQMIVVFIRVIKVWPKNRQLSIIVFKSYCCKKIFQSGHQHFFDPPQTYLKLFWPPLFSSRNLFDPPFTAPYTYMVTYF